MSSTAGAAGASINPHDHALVFGIRRYFGTASGWPHDLLGPDNDAAAVADWLADPAGGGLAKANVHIIRSAEAPDPFEDGRGLPGQAEVIAALQQVVGLPRIYKDEENRQFAGRRLYIFVSGHGWATKRKQAALVTAEAIKERAPNVDVTSWADYLAEAGAFKEIILWADTCATRTDPTVVEGTPAAFGAAPIRHPNAAHVRIFEGFAAGIGLRAVENRMDDGSWHGAFTWALVQALRGQARTPVTTDTLCEYLRNAMKTFQSQTDKERRGVAHEPAFGSRDPITFATPTRQTVRVKITFPPACVGQVATITQGRNAPPIATKKLTGTSWTVSLEPALYHVGVAAGNVSALFEAMGESVVAVELA